jgi:uncharacterized protein
MIIHLQQIPADGLHLEGEEDRDILELADEGIQPAGPLYYSLDVGLSGDGLFVTGRLSLVLELTCVACLDRFPCRVEVPDFAAQIALTGPETVDLTPLLREDMVLALPPYPHCDSDGQRTCRGAALPESYPAPVMSQVWSELDKLKIKTD